MARWSGWWEQRGYGRQEMRNLVLNVGPDGSLSGSGEDCIGKFMFSGTIFPQVELVKQYLGQHSLLYVGTNAGEGIFGTWRIPGLDLFPGFNTGRFALFPVPDASADRIAVRELKSARALNTAGQFWKMDDGSASHRPDGRDRLLSRLACGLATTARTRDCRTRLRSSHPSA
ncbi:MAG: hypothetical protein ACLQNE_32215 [Thermoguttaceae bacterium]